jgi:hypothetical protein
MKLGGIIPITAHIIQLCQIQLLYNLVSIEDEVSNNPNNSR